jgi:hypothetical protein
MNNLQKWRGLDCRSKQDTIRQPMSALEQQPRQSAHPHVLIKEQSNEGREEIDNTEVSVSSGDLSALVGRKPHAKQFI